MNRAKILTQKQQQVLTQLRASDGGMTSWLKGQDKLAARGLVHMGLAKEHATISGRTRFEALPLRDLTIVIRGVRGDDIDRVRDAIDLTDFTYDSIGYREEPSK